MFIDSFLLLIFAASFWSYKIPKLLKLPSSSKDEMSKSICRVELNMPSIAKNKRFWLLWSLIFRFHILHNRSIVLFCDFLAGIVDFLVGWLTGTNECCVYPTAFWSFADVTHEQISIMRAQEMFYYLCSISHALWNVRSGFSSERNTSKNNLNLSITCSVYSRHHYKTRALI